MTTIGFGDFTPWTPEGRAATIFTSMLLVSFFPTWVSLLYRFIHQCTKQLHNKTLKPEANFVKIEVPAKFIRLCSEDGWCHITDRDGNGMKIRTQWVTDIPDTLEGCDCLHLDEAGNFQPKVELQETP